MRARIERLLDRLDLVLEADLTSGVCALCCFKKDAPAGEGGFHDGDLRSIGPDFATLLVREALTVVSVLMLVLQMSGWRNAIFERRQAESEGDWKRFQQVRRQLSHARYAVALHSCSAPCLSGPAHVSAQTEVGSRFDEGRWKLRVALGAT